MTLIRAARALASLEKKHEVGEAQMKRIAPMALSHRLRRNPLDEQSSTARVQRALEEVLRMTPDGDAGLSLWERAALAAEAFALAPSGCGIVVRRRPGPVRDAWLARLTEALPSGTPFRRIPASIADDRLIGGLDIPATLKAGRPVAEKGLIAETDGGVLVVAMAERLPSGIAARIAAALDEGEITLERDGMSLTSPARVGYVALDEGADDEETPPPILIERSAYFVDLDNVAIRDLEGTDDLDRDARAEARARFDGMDEDVKAMEAIVGVAASLGIASLRAPLYALRAARALAALEGADAIDRRHLALAAALSLAHRATRLPSAPEDEPPEENPEDERRRRPRTRS